MSTRLAAAVALCAATTLLPLGPSLPALAGEPVMIEITDLDSSVPGRLTAIVRTEDPEARLGVLDASGEHLPLTAFYHRELDVADGVARVEVETWGLDDDKTYLLEVATCGGWDHACATATAPFVPTDVTPTVTFSTDPVLTGTEQATVDVEDDGVGLEAVLYTRTQPLRSGQQELRLEEGRTVVSVRRCGRLGCHRFDPTATYTVSKGALSTGRWSAEAVLPDQSSEPDATVAFTVEDTVPYRFDGQVVPGRPGPTDAGPGVSVAGLQPDAEGRVLVPVDLTPLAHGTYELIGTFSRTTASGDVVQHAHSFPITVDREGPTAYGGYLSLGTFHPSPDGYRDRVHLVTSISSDDVDAATLRMIHDSTGHDVVVPSTLDAATDRLSAEWDGRVAGGALAPAGRWTAVVDAVDPRGNVQRTVVDGVRLTHQQVEPVRRVYTVSAQRSREDTRTWRCARVVRGPGSWTHGLGYRARTCHLQAGARTSHAFGRVPRGWIDGTIALGALGRSAETRPHRIPSEASLHLEGRRRRATRMLDTVGWYSTGARPDRSVLDTTSGKVEWDVEIDHATRYDVKAFRIVFEGRALR